LELNYEDYSTQSIVGIYCGWACVPGCISCDCCILLVIYVSNTWVAIMSNKDYRYLECEKLIKVADDSQLIGAYIEWSMGRDDLDHLTIEERLAKDYDIDLVKVEKERRLIMQRM